MNAHNPSITTRLRAMLAQLADPYAWHIKHWCRQLVIDAPTRARLHALEQERPDTYARLIGLRVFSEREREVVNEDSWRRDQARVGFVLVAVVFGAETDQRWSSSTLASAYASALARVDDLFAALEMLPEPETDTEHRSIRDIELCCLHHKLGDAADARFEHGVRHRDEQTCDWSREDGYFHASMVSLYRDRVVAALTDHPNALKWAVSHGRLLCSKRRTPEKVERSLKRGRKLLARLPGAVVS